MKSQTMQVRMIRTAENIADLEREDFPSFLPSSLTEKIRSPNHSKCPIAAITSTFMPLVTLNR